MMRWRNQTVAKIETSTLAISVLMFVCLFCGVSSCLLPTESWLKLPIVVITLLAWGSAILNLEPHYFPSLKYPYGKIIGPAAIFGWANLILSMAVSGGVPEAGLVDGSMTFYVVNHDVRLQIDVWKFYWMTSAFPIAMGLVLLHVLLDLRARWHVFVRDTMSNAKGESSV
jgi:hypothetical protein